MLVYLRGTRVGGMKGENKYQQVMVQNDDRCVIKKHYADYEDICLLQSPIVQEQHLQQLEVGTKCDSHLLDAFRCVLMGDSQLNELGEVQIETH